MKRLEILAHREDGLGCRLSNIINALAVCESLDARFRFGWPAPAQASQAVPTLTEIFSKDFIERYALSDVEPSRYKRWAGNPLPMSVVARAKKDLKCRGIHYRWWKRGATLGQTGDNPIGPDALQQAARRIEFAKPIVELSATARKLLPPEAVVIHARRGDIVYGQSRVQLWNDKYAPLALLKGVIRYLQVRRVPIVVVSDDVATLEVVKSFSGVLSSSDLKPAGCEEEGRAALFDMFLMASCELVISTQSGLSAYAALAAGRKVIHMLDYFAKLAAIDAIRDDLAAAPHHYSTLDRIKVRQYMALELGDAMTTEDRLRTLAQVSREDPHNPTYAQVHAVALLRAGKGHEAERVLASAADTLLAARGAASGELAEYSHGLAIDDGYALLAAHAGPAYPFITAQLSKHRLERGDVGQAARLAEMALRANPEHPVLLIQALRAAMAGGDHERVTGLQDQLQRVSPDLSLVRSGSRPTPLPIEGAS